MKEKVKEFLKENWWFKIFSLIAVLLMITSFFLPPMGVIDDSALLGVAALFAFAALGTVIKAIDNGMSAKMSKGDVSIEVGMRVDQEDMPQE